jgi:hypothetical protein
MHTKRITIENKGITKNDVSLLQTVLAKK